MSDLILFIMMCLSMVVLVCIDFWGKKEDSVILQRVYRVCLVLLLSGMLFQRYALEWMVGYKTGGFLAYPAGLGANLVCCALIILLVYLLRWLWTGKWD